MAKTDNFCSSCVQWDYTYPDAEKKYGKCTSVFVDERIRVAQDYDSIENDEPTIFTEANFGCIFHQAKDQNVVAVIRLPKKN